jgi:hypothetical protein
MTEAHHVVGGLVTAASEPDLNKRGLESGEAHLFHELALLERHPPYTFTTRRKNILKHIDFPEDVEYNEASVERPLPIITDEMRDAARSFGFCTLHLSPSDLMTHWFVMFSELDLFAKLNLAPSCLREFFRNVHNAYRDNIYHNFQHAMDVAQFAYAVYSSSDKVRAIFDEIDILSCLVLGLAHDMDHPGVNNAFLIKTQDPIAILYNDQSVLENAHAASLFSLMRTKPECNILAGLDRETYFRARKTIMRGILATDMGRHFALVKEFQEAPATPAAADVDEKARMMLIDCLAKCGDICHLVRPWPVAKEWEDLVMIEFFQQGDQEKALGFTPDALFDRDVCKVPNSQCWFYENMGKPLFEALARHVPETEHLVTTMMDENLPNWKAMC